jgi:alpha-L-rhamnosidase
MYYGTLVRAAEIAEGIGEPTQAIEWREKAESLKSAVNAYLYLTAEHRYLTNIYQSLPTSPTPHAQAWPLAYGLVPDEEVDLVSSALLELLSTNPSSPNLDIYGMYWVLEGLGRAGHIPEALEIINRYYGYMIERGASTWWETWLANLGYSNSLSHGWGGSPTWFLTTYVLGAARLGPDQWMVRPALGSLEFASGKIPLASGVLEVQWGREVCGESYLRIFSEEATSGVIVFRDDYLNSTITDNGVVIWNAGSALADYVSLEGGEIHIRASGGNHDLLLRQECELTGEN